jgi:FkbM family methyltransferase
MRAIRITALLIIVSIGLWAVREVTLCNVGRIGKHEGYRQVARIVNAGQYRLYSVRNYRVFLNITESRMMYQRAVGQYETEIFEDIGARLAPGMTFVDIGANKGDYSLFAGHLVGDSGHVIAVEPIPENVCWIRRSIEENDLRNIHVADVALSDQDGEATFFLGAKSGWGSLLGRPRENREGEITVQTRTLDSLLPELPIDRVDAMKIDIEGGENLAIRGAEHVIERFRPVIWLDLHPHDGADVGWLHDFFAQSDFWITTVFNPTAPLESFSEEPSSVLILPHPPTASPSSRAAH